MPEVHPLKKAGCTKPLLTAAARVADMHTSIAAQLHTYSCPTCSSQQNTSSYFPRLSSIAASIMTRCRRDSAIATPDFEYDALPAGDFFRVLVLHPGHGKEAIRCHLEIQSHRRLRSKKYEAISYVWGKFNDTVPI